MSVPHHVHFDIGGREFLAEAAIANNAIYVWDATNKRFRPLTTLSGLTLTAPILDSYSDYTAIATPGDPAANTVRLWAEVHDTFSVLHVKDISGISFYVTQDNISIIRNNSGATITKGSWVYISGATSTWPTVALAKADSITTTPVAGIAIADIANNSFGQIMTLGMARNIDTSAFADGNVLYLSAATAGLATTTPPTGTNVLQRLGVVVKGASVGAGIIAVFVGGEFNPGLTQTLGNKTLTAPTIADFSNAAHDHGDADDGGGITGNQAITLTTAAQPNVTSLGTLTVLNVNGDINGAPAATQTVTLAPSANSSHVVIDEKAKDGSGNLVWMRLFANYFGDVEIGSVTNHPVVFIANNQEVGRWNTTKIIKIADTATRATTEGTNHLDIFNGTAPVGTLTNGISLYSSAGEAYFMDAAGNASLQSPHDREGRYIYRSKDTLTGRVLEIDMEKLARKLDEMFGGGYIREWVERD